MVAVGIVRPGLVMLRQGGSLGGRRLELVAELVLTVRPLCSGGSLEIWSFRVVVRIVVRVTLALIILERWEGVVTRGRPVLAGVATVGIVGSAGTHLGRVRDVERRSASIVRRLETGAMTPTVVVAGTVSVLALIHVHGVLTVRTAVAERTLVLRLMSVVAIVSAVKASRRFVGRGLRMLRRRQQIARGGKIVSTVMTLVVVNGGISVVGAVAPVVKDMSSLQVSKLCSRFENSPTEAQMSTDGSVIASGVAAHHPQA